MGPEAAKENSGFLISSLPVLRCFLLEQADFRCVVEASDFYVFDYIDPPAVMERKSEPVRSLICIIGAFLGAVFGCFIVLIRYYAFGKKLF